MNIAIKTLGCKANRYESDKIFAVAKGRHRVFNAGGLVRGLAGRLAGGLAGGLVRPDIIIVNTCTVTHVADRKSRRAIRSLKSANPSCKVVVFGCGPNVAREDFEAIKEVDEVFGNVDEVIEFIEKLGALKDDLKASGGDDGSGNNDGLRTRAVVKIQDGCNNYCAYCIIPRARGPEVSFDKDKILREVRRKEANGFREIILTGIIMSNWKQDGMDFPDLIEFLLKNTSSVRFRISSIEPQNFSDKFVRLFLNDRVCPHVHMSLQSGSDSVLERMRRKYDVALYLDVCRRLREAVPDIGLTTDVIVGFPGESDEEFEKTCDFVRDIGFLKMHVFPYSRRKNTAAYHMEDQVSEDVKKKRACKLRAISDELGMAFVNGLLGNEYDVIVETCENGVCTGVTPNYIPVQFSCSGENLVGKIFKLRLEKRHSFISPDFS
jgi:threonylcarbamoyladenosine tRNA methylthiotransferase MtaB